MRISFLLKHDALSGGIRVVSIYAEKLQRMGHKVIVISTPQKSPSLKQKVKFLLSGKGRSAGSKKASYFDGLNVEHIIIDKYRPIKNKDVPDADVVIATYWETAEWVTMLHPSKGKKYYFVQGHETFEWLPVDRVKATYRMPLKKITISQWLIDILRKEYEQSDVTLVPNSVDADFFNSKPRVRQETPTVGFMYSPAAIKGCDTIITALNMVSLKIPALRILVFGSRQVSPIHSLPQNAEFHFQPPQDKIREIYVSCDFWIFGSIAEGFGLPILEAMACRTPVIATSAGAAPELMAKKGGVLLKSKNAEDMANAIFNCFESSSGEWRKMSDKARKTAEAYTWDDAVILFERSLLDRSDEESL